MNLLNLGDYDIDEHLPANINSSHHTLQDISNSDHSQNDFSLLHMNIRSLSCHFDELVSTLVSLAIKFDVVGVSETWDSFENPIKSNVCIIIQTLILITLAPIYKKFFLILLSQVNKFFFLGISTLIF